MDKNGMKRHGAEHTQYRRTHSLAACYRTHKTFNTADKEKKLNTFPLLFISTLIQTL